MIDRPVLQLRKGEDRRIRAGHVWVFSNEIDVGATPLTAIEPGAIVAVRDARGAFLGIGYANPASLISVRLLTRDRRAKIDEDFFRARLRRALDLRETLFPDEPYYRLAFGEADGLPGLTVDRFGEYLVVQPTTAGIDRVLDSILGLLVELTSARGILVRADAATRDYEGLDRYVRPAYGEVPPMVSLRENGVRFEVPLAEGQKTGWFYDHRVNRSRVRPYVRGARVLDVFSYVGGWGVQAAAFDAESVLCVDSSVPALDALLHNAELNDVADRVRIDAGDAFDVLRRLREEEQRFDVVILDPPAFIKRRKDVKEGERAYGRLNRLGMDVVREGGMLITASCSYHMSREALLRAVLREGMRGSREVQIVEEGGQGPDHPIHPAIPETNYLKSYFVRTI